MLSTVFQLVVLILVIKLNIKIKNCKISKFHVISDVVSYKSGLIYKILKGMNTFLYDGLAGQKTRRTTQTTMRRYKYAIQKSVHFFNILIFYI
jgi:hypothetical protein